MSPKPNPSPKAVTIATLAILALLVALAWIDAASAQGDAPRTATITFRRPVQYVDGTPISPDTEITYRLYQGARGAEKQRVAEFSGTSTTVNSGLKPGETCWQVSAVANGVESELSNEGCKTFPLPAAEPVIITVT